MRNLLSFSSAYEFPATYVYGFRDRFASREIGLSTYYNSTPAPSCRRTRTRAQDCPSCNYVFHQVRETSGAKESDFRNEDRVVRCFCRTITFFIFDCIFFFLPKELFFIERTINIVHHLLQQSKLFSINNSLNLYYITRFNFLSLFQFLINS